MLEKPERTDRPDADLPDQVEKHIARPLGELAELIKDDLAKGDEAGLPFYRAAGEKLLEAKAQLKHGEFQKWVQNNFKITPRHARRYMDLAQKGHASPFSSLNDFIRKTKKPNSDRPHFAEDHRARFPVDTDADAECKAERDLWLQIVDAGFNALAKQLHPDAGGVEPRYGAAQQGPEPYEGARPTMSNNTDNAETYWLHVDSKGVEHRLLSEREHESVFVEVKDGFETTTTRNAKFHWDRIGVHKPHGRGWKILDATSDNFTIWRRRARKQK